MRISPQILALGVLLNLQGCLIAAEHLSKASNQSLPCCSEAQVHGAGPACVPCQAGTEAWSTREATLLRDVFTDFSGRQFTFEGEDESYNLFTEADHQLNAILAHEDPSERQLGVTLRGVGIHGPDTSVGISIASSEHLTVVVNERIFKDDATRLDGVIITRGCPIADCVNQSSLATVNVRDRFLALTAWVMPAEGNKPLSLAFKISLMERPMSQVHGLLGQSLESHELFEGKQAVTMPSNLQFYGEGQISDYSTTDLFSSDSTFSIFTRKAERRRQKRKRQMLEGNALASMAFAAKTESGIIERRRFPK